MTKPLVINLQLTNTDIVFCYGQKVYRKYMQRNRYDDGVFSLDAVTSVVTSSSEYFKIVIGTRKSKDIRGLKALVVHEISHAVTQWMGYYGFNCDEVRSYTLQYLYIEIMQHLDQQLKLVK